MKRRGIYKPTIEDAVEISGIEILHPGGFELTKRTAELAKLKPGLKILDVSSGRGTQSIYYAKEYNVDVTGIDLDDEMLKTATLNTEKEILESNVRFQKADSQNLPFQDNMFDVVINECAVGIPDNSQKVIDEMIRVVKKGGLILIHESTWKSKLTPSEKEEISERYGTTPLELSEWRQMLENSGAVNIYYEFKEWSKPEMFWKIRKNRNVKHWLFTMTIKEKILTAIRIYTKYGLKGIVTVFKNEKVFYKAVLDGKIGYALFRGEKQGFIS